MRVVLTGQVGLDKKDFLDEVAAIAAENGQQLPICNIGDMMYAEAPDVARGRILDLPLSRLNSLRRSVFKDVLRMADKNENLVINTHATFRWRHGLFYAFDFDQTQSLNADRYVVLVDNVDRVHYRLNRDGHVDHTLKDLMVWREEEILATELVSQIVTGHRCFYILSRGADPRESGTAETLYRLIFQPEMKTAYLSFPMSHVVGRPKVLSEIEGFRREMKRLFTCFDPADMEEKYLGDLAFEATQQGHRTIEVGPPEEKTTLDAAETLNIIADIDGQIYVRDFKLIDQSDMIISLIPQLEDGTPGLSSGVERELQHAHEATRETFIIWQPDRPPSPFVTETASRVFRSTPEAVQFFIDEGYVASEPAGRLFE